ncbi:hydrogen gas-evolving membrane-bound hydrogenase subunit E [Candidatus Nanohalococcus occultus]|uniref:Multicomponent Na:H antiporter subunit A n=1 Tax=Candidatus Nanohalococcus occultus TaxID=2978047 RepID=A0ABY8CFQ5_9ARCH|nr:Multicomponent Na :H antiporter subunit A [Candidatus Nanohaloarchaeota archaeon SVXNc]
MNFKTCLITLALSLYTQTVTASSNASVQTGSLETAVLTAILAPFLTSAVIAVFYTRLEDYSAIIGSLSGLISFIAAISLIGKTGVVSYLWIPSMNIAAQFYVDGLSVFFGLLASGIGVLVFLYSWKYMEHGEWKRKYYTALTAFMGSMIGLVFSSNLILLFLFWEFTSICSFVLISHHQRKRAGIMASKKSLLVTVGSGLALLLGFILLGSATDTYSIVEMLSDGQALSALESTGLTTAVVALIGIGAAGKSAQIPLHIWLPDAMEAPTPVSSFLHSATMVKAGVFLLLRFRSILGEAVAWNFLLLTLGLSTMFIAALLAVASTELKQLLAYSTASHLGLIVAGIGFPTAVGVETSLFHVLNHAVFKAGLFMVAGIVLHEAGTQKFSELSGLRHDWPGLAAIGTLLSLSMAGIPPFNGFYSKELLFEAAYHTASHTGGITWILPAISVLGSVFTFIYSLKFISVFYGRKSQDLHDVPRKMILSPAILAVTTIAITATPNQFISVLVNPALELLAHTSHGLSVHMPKNLKPAFVMSLITIGLGSFGIGYLNVVERKAKKITALTALSPNKYYFKALDKADELSNRMITKVESGLLRTYAVWVLIISTVTGTAGYLLAGPLPAFQITATLPAAVVLAVSLVSVSAVLRSQSYTSSVMILSILGFMVSIFYLLLDAPDLVLTQLVVETMSLIVFLLVLNKLPSFDKEISFDRKKRDTIISAIAGLMVFLSVMYSTAEETPSKVADYFIGHAVSGSGGGNVVNVILVDFRGLDTLGEVSVIAMAGLAVLMLFKMRGVEQ